MLASLTGYSPINNQLEHNIALGTLLLILVYILGTILFVPGLLLTIGAGVALRAGLKSTWSMQSVNNRSDIAWLFGCVDWSHDWFLPLHAAWSVSTEESY